MTQRVNRAIEQLAQDQAIYYVGGHTGHVLTYEQGCADARTWADYINVGMEHGAFDMAGLAAYMQGLVDGGPTESGHRTPTVVVEAPVNGTDAANVRFNAWQLRQILARGVHGILLCQAESADAVRAFVESCRYPHQLAGVDPRRHLRSTGCAAHRRRPPTNGKLGVGTRGRGSEPTAAPIWGLEPEEYLERCDPWPLNPIGELLLGVKLESPKASPTASTSSTRRGWASPSSARAISGCHSATYACRASRTHPRWPRRASACSPRAARGASRSSRAPRPKPSPTKSTRACGSSPASGRRRPRPAARTVGPAALRNATPRGKRLLQNRAE